MWHSRDVWFDHLDNKLGHAIIPQVLVGGHHTGNFHILWKLSCVQFWELTIYICFVLHMKGWWWGPFIYLIRLTWVSLIHMLPHEFQHNFHVHILFAE